MKVIKRYSKQFLLLLIFFLTLTPLNILAETNNDIELNYVALGDSLAAGYLNDSSLPIGKGYPLFIQEGIEVDPVYNVDLINRGVGGYTTIDVLNQLSDVEVRNDIANADLITLNIGANDLLGAVGDLGNLDTNDSDAVQETLQNVGVAFEQIEGNLDGILNEIKTLNDEATIYIMGYYNALHYLEGETLQELTANVMGLLNNTMANYGEKYGAYYVPTFDAFEGKYNEFLPKPDIHPTEAGYQVIGNLFLDQIIPNLEEVEAPDIEKPIITLIGDNPLTLEVGDSYDELGATAEDNVDGDVTDAIEISGEVDALIVGTYEVVYTVSDVAGNEATETRMVNVIEAAVEEPENLVDKSVLENKLADIEREGLVAMVYTKESWATFEKALLTANDIISNKDATQDKIDDVLVVLIAAKKDLEEQEKELVEQGKPGVEGKPGADGKPGEKGKQAADNQIIVQNVSNNNVSTAEVDSEGRTMNRLPSDVSASSDQESTINGSGVLPNTATKNPLLIAVGAGLSIVGGILMFIRRRLVL